MKLCSILLLAVNAYTVFTYSIFVKALQPYQHLIITYG